MNLIFSQTKQRETILTHNTNRHCRYAFLQSDNFCGNCSIVYKNCVHFKHVNCFSAQMSFNSVYHWRRWKKASIYTYFNNDLPKGTFSHVRWTKICGKAQPAFFMGTEVWKERVAYTGHGALSPDHSTSFSGAHTSSVFTCGDARTGRSKIVYILVVIKDYESAFDAVKMFIQIP